MFEQIYSVRKERNIKCDDKAAIRDNALLAESTRDNWITQKSGIIKNKCKLWLVTQFIIIEFFIKNQLRGNNKGGHDQYTSQ